MLVLRDITEEWWWIQTPGPNTHRMAYTPKNQGVCFKIGHTYLMRSVSDPPNFIAAELTCIRSAHRPQTRDYPSGFSHHYTHEVTFRRF